MAGCAVALALAKKGIVVTIMTSPFDERGCHVPWMRRESLEEKVQDLQTERGEPWNCSRAHEQLAMLAQQSVEELLGSNNWVDGNGNIDIHRCLHDQLKEYPQVEWMSHHRLIELLTLDRHSAKQADRYKRPACFGVVAYHDETQSMEDVLAKETILATGGASSLFPYSSHPSRAWRGGIAIAFRGGARLLNMDQIHFHPLGLFQRDKSCFPLPLGLLAEGGKIYASKTLPIEADCSSPDSLLYQLDDQLLKTGDDHLFLDLTSLDHAILKKKFPATEAYCLSHGFNVAKEPLPIVPIALHTCGGVAVDRFSQTTLQRLRAIGGVACTGLFWNFKEEALSVLERLTWAMTCAEDIAKQVNKFIYYFPDLRERSTHLTASSSIVKKDWRVLRQTMWSYVGIHRDRAHLDRGYALLNQLALLNAPHHLTACSIEQIQLCDAIQTAQLIADSARTHIGQVHPHSGMERRFLE